MKIGVKKLYDGARIPTYAHDTDSGMDVYCPIDYLVGAFCTVTIQTGIALNIPDGYEIQVRPRSSLSAKGMVIAFGTVDCGYKGEIGVTIYNTTRDPKLIQKGDRVAQLVLSPIVRAEIEEVSDVGNSSRGNSGFGSTGR